ncbi:Hypothetical predicted protein, partial [Paramuricea clavata]
MAMTILYPITMPLKDNTKRVPLETYFSSYDQLIRRTATIFMCTDRMAKTITTDATCNLPNPSPEHVQRATIFHVKRAQAQNFNAEITALRQNKPIPNTSRIRKEAPFLDANGLLRVDGRLHQGEFPPDQQHPIVLPKNHRITQLI